MPALSLPRLLAGRYVLHEEIAAGGMAAVHFGQLQGPSGFTKDVAIKRLHPHVASEPGFATMLLDEARLTARIEHPNVVATLDVISAGDELFIVMEYVHGETLARLLRLARERGERVPVEVTVGILVGVLRGLSAAHEATDDRGQRLGIVHRDVTPQNVLVGADGVPRVLDFGIAKAAGRLHSTSDGRVKGKVAYMAPEQIRGEPVDARTDVFAASVVLWEALAGERLFDGASPAETMARVLAGSTKPPSRVVANLSPALDDITLTGLAPKADERFQSALAMANALENAVPPASARRIAEWIAGLALEALDARKRRWAELHLDAASTAAARPTSPDPLPPAERSATGTLNAATSSSPAASRPKGSRVARLGLGLGVAVGVGLLAASLARRSGPAPVAVVSSIAPALPREAAPAAPPPAIAPALPLPAPVASAASSAPVVATPPLLHKHRTPHPSSPPVGQPTPEPPAVSAPVSTPRCHYVKIPDDAGIIRPVNVCD